MKLIGTKYGTVIGAFMLSYAGASLFIGIAFQLMNASTWYNTTGRYVLPSWLNGWGFFGLLALVLTIVLLVFKYYITPAYVEYTSKVTWASNNPTKKELKEIEKRFVNKLEVVKGELLEAIKTTKY